VTEQPKNASETELTLIAALAEGALGYHSEAIPEELFNESRRPIVKEIIAFHKASGHWPGKAQVPMICSALSTFKSDEADRVAAVPEQYIAWIKPKAVMLLRKNCLRMLSLAAATQASFEAPDLAALENSIQDIKRLGEPPAVSFDFEDYMNRGRYEVSEQDIIAPISLPSIQKVKLGLRGTEHGLVLAPTKRGKSFFCVWLAMQAMQANLDVVYITLEVSAEELAERFLRGMIGDPKGVTVDAYRQACQKYNGKRPDIRFFPRYAIGTGMVRDIVRRKHNLLGSNFVVMVDYGALLRPDGGNQRHQEVGDIHARLCAIAQEFRVPIWSPFQTNRSGADDGEKLSTFHSGESYLAMTHVDLVLALDQTQDEATCNQMRVNMAASRSSQAASATIVYDWSRLHIAEASFKGSTSVDPVPGAELLRGYPGQ
jgi:hypothetical protein